MHICDYLIVGAGLAGASAVEGIREVDSRMDTVSDWQKPYDTGTIYYLRDGVIRGAMMCNVWDKVEETRRLITTAARADQPAIGIR